MKVCPVCGAGAFDDADVCFGCLHRYDEQAARGDGMPMVSVPPAPNMRPLVPDSPLEPGLRPSKPSVAEPAQRLPDVAHPRMPIMREAPVEAAVVEPSAAVGLREGAAWVVRFEFPGFTSAGEGCALLRSDAVKSDAPCDMVVRLQPIASATSTERRRGRPARGSHVRVPDKEDVAAVALPSRV